MITSRATGQVEGRQVFGPYGEKLPNFTSGYQPLTGYTGHTQQDPDGLTYMRGRFYATAWHRFLNSDQGADPSTFNQMAYVGGSPFEAIDPSGMAKVKKGTKAWTKDRKLVECEAEGGCDTGSPEGWALSESDGGGKTVEVIGHLGLGYQYAPAQTGQPNQPSAWDLFKENTSYSFHSTNDVMFSKPCKWALGAAAGSWASAKTGLSVLGVGGAPILVKTGETAAIDIIAEPSAALAAGTILGTTTAFGVLAGSVALESGIMIGSVIYGIGATAVDLYRR